MAAHAICAAAFSGSHLCHESEYVMANSPMAVPSQGAWIDFSIDHNDKVTAAGSPLYRRGVGAGSCFDFTSSDAIGSTMGTYLSSSGDFSTSTGVCRDLRPLACCSTPAKTRFAGFTSTRTTGKAGGRHGMHAICAAAFAGSHLCHEVEFLRANPAVSVPTDGAWLDRSSSSARISGGCFGWTSDTAVPGGALVTAAGGIDSRNCGTARALACCL